MSKERKPAPEKFTIEDVVASAKEATLLAGGHQPTIVVEGSQQHAILTIEQLADTHEGRVDQIAMAGWLVGSASSIGVLEQVFLVTEAWVSHREEGKEPVLPPSADPQRKEVLIIASYNISEDKTDMRMLEMIRDKEDKLIDLIPHPVSMESGASVQAPLLMAFVQGYIIGLMEPPTV